MVRMETSDNIAFGEERARLQSYKSPYAAARAYVRSVGTTDTGTASVYAKGPFKDDTTGDWYVTLWTVIARGLPVESRRQVGTVSFSA